MDRRAFLAAGLVGVGLAGCDYVPDFARPLLGRVLSPDDIAKGAFSGQLKVIFLEPKNPDDRSIQLIESFGYKDRNGLEWMVPAGYVSDGASIPWELWGFIGGPFDGPYRDAAVIHDYYCDTRDRTWEDVHAMFLEASLRRGVAETKAQTMYAGILYGGPRWDAPALPLTKAQVLPGSGGSKPAVDPGITRRGATEGEKQDFEELKRWIEREKPSPEEIRKRVEGMRQQKGLPSRK